MTKVEEGLSAEHATGQCRRLATVLTTTRQMLEHAGAGDWDEVAELERGRREDLRLCFSQSVAPEQSELVAEALAVMLHLNEELMALLATARDTVLQQGVKQARTRSALGNYQDIQHSAG